MEALVTFPVSSFSSYTLGFISLLQDFMPLLVGCILVYRRVRPNLRNKDLNPELENRIKCLDARGARFGVNGIRIMGQIKN